MASGYEKAASGVDPTRGWDTGNAQGPIQRVVDCVIWLVSIGLFTAAVYKIVSSLIG